MTYRCPDCGAETRVLSTRDDKERRRECLGPSGHRFTTYEVLSENLPLGILAHDALADFRKYIRERVLNDRTNSYAKYLPRV